MSAWSGFGDYVERIGAPMTGQGDAANFEQMLEKALAAEAAAPPTTTYETTVCIIGGGVGGLAAAAALSGRRRRVPRLRAGRRWKREGRATA